MDSISYPEAFAMAAAVSVVGKFVLDIATSAPHKSMVSRAWMIGRDFVPASLLIAGGWFGVPALTFVSLVAAVMVFVLRDGPPTRVEAAYLILFACLSLYFLQAQIILDFVNAQISAQHK